MINFRTSPFSISVFEYSRVLPGLHWSVLSVYSLLRLCSRGLLPLLLLLLLLTAAVLALPLLVFSSVSSRGVKPAATSFASREFGNPCEKKRVFLL